MTHNDLDVLIAPPGLDAFCDLASRLYGPLEQAAGGPLHVELEDHNTWALTGADSVRSKKQMEIALAMIEAGEIPTAYTPDGLYERNLAFWYAREPEALRVSIAILEVTEPWSESQADAAYAVWQRRSGRVPCTCQEWPEFGEPA